jgi:uncharacterized protein (DUF433 family)
MSNIPLIYDLTICQTGVKSICGKVMNNYQISNLDRITFNPRIMAGQACIRGMRVPVSLIINLVANGKTTGEIIEDYPYLEPEDIQQSLMYAALLTREQVFPIIEEQVG